MKYLITGGCGFLGSNLAAEVLHRGEELLVLDNLSRHGSALNLAWLQTLGTFTHQAGDIRNAHDVAWTIERFRPDVIFHLAGQVAMTTSLARPSLDFETNVVGSFNLLEAVRKHAPEATIVYSSTNKVYGDLEQFQYQETDTRFQCVDRPNGFGEDTPLEFRSPYGCSKGAADQYMLDFARMFGLKTVVFRHSSMYGGRQFATYDQGWVGWFCEQALRTRRGTLERPFTISGSGKQVRDVLHAADMKRLYFAAVERVDQAKGQAFNIGGGMANSLSLLELFGLLEDVIEVKLSYERLPSRESDQRVFVADISKAKRLLGWEPEVTTPIGIRSMIDWLSGSENSRGVPV